MQFLKYFHIIKKFIPAELVNSINIEISDMSEYGKIKTHLTTKKADWVKMHVYFQGDICCLWKPLWFNPIYLDLHHENTASVEYCHIDEIVIDSFTF